MTGLLLIPDIMVKTLGGERYDLSLLLKVIFKVALFERLGKMCQRLIQIIQHIILLLVACPLSVLHCNAFNLRPDK